MNKKIRSLILIASLISLSQFNTACSMTSVHQTEKPNEASTADKAPAAPAAPAVDHSAAIAAIATAAPTPAAPADHSAHAPAAAPASHGGAHHAEGVEPAKALGWMKNGNTRFTKGNFRKDGAAKKDIERLAAGQKPHTIVLSCSDSRVPPEVVFDQKLGELFVVRTAGEALDNSAIASIEYAAEHLGARLIVVMGHTSCGAVKAALGTLDGADAGSPALNSLVRDIHPRIASFKGKAPSKDVKTESWANTRGVAKDLMERSKIIREKVTGGEMMIKSALYNLDHGNVDFDQ